MKKIIYTVLTGNVDDLKEPQKAQSDWTYVAFTDNPELKSPVWDTVLIPKGEPKKTSRFYKIKNHFPEYDLSLFIDATFEIKRQPLDKFALSKTEGIWLNAHPQRQCTYEEADIVKSKSLDDPNLIDKQITKYQSEGLPEQWGLWRCGIMVRNPKDERITEMCNLWWDEVEQGSWRDQVSFPYACYKTGVTPNSILHGITQIYFRQHLHKSSATTEWLYVANSGEPPKPAYEEYKNTIDRYDTAHLILLSNGFLTPAWMKNYISPKVGIQRFEELVKILNGVIVRA